MRPGKDYGGPIISYGSGDGEAKKSRCLKFAIFLGLALLVFGFFVFRQLRPSDGWFNAVARVLPRSAPAAAAASSVKGEEEAISLTPSPSTTPPEKHGKKSLAKGVVASDSAGEDRVEWVGGDVLLRHRGARCVFVKKAGTPSYLDEELRIPGYTYDARIFVLSNREQGKVRVIGVRKRADGTEDAAYLYFHSGDLVEHYKETETYKGLGSYNNVPSDIPKICQTVFEYAPYNKQSKDELTE